MLSTSAFALLAASVTAAPPQVTFLPSGSSAYDVSNDGGVVVGVTATGGFRWTPLGGFVSLVGPAAGFGSLVVVSGDGTQIAADILDANSKQHAARWLGGSAWAELPAFVSCDSFLLNTYGANGDGSVIVGLAWIAGCKAHAFRWDPVNGTVDLGSTVAGKSSRANGVDDSGNLIVGWQDQINGQRRGAKWTGGVQSYVPNYVSPGGTSYTLGEALGVSANGAHIVGYTVFGLNGGNAWQSSISSGQTKLLPQLAGFTGQAALALGVADDGATAVGTTGGFPPTRKAIIWVNGVPQDLKTYIESKGGSIAPYTSLGTASAVSADGRTIVGWGTGASGQPAGWVVRFATPCPSDLNGDGTVDGVDLAIVLGDWGATGGIADVDQNGIVDGADLALILGAWGDCPA